MHVRVALSKRRELTVSQYLSPQARGWWLVYVPSSSSEFVSMDEAELAVLREPFGDRAPHILTLNKPGLSPNSRIDRELFDRSWTREQRLADYAHVLRTLIPQGDSIFMIGFSEGAYLAPELAHLDSRIRVLALLSGGTRSWLDEEIALANDRTLASTMRQLARVYGAPESLRRWKAIPHRAWNSFDNEDTLAALCTLQIPVHTFHGRDDDMIDLKATLDDLKRLRKVKPNWSSRVWRGVGHDLGEAWLKSLRASAVAFAANPEFQIHIKNSQLRRSLSPSDQTALVGTAHRE